MASTTYIDKITVINNTWLNDVNGVVWTVFNGATTATLARTAISAAKSGANTDITSLGAQSSVGVVTSLGATTMAANSAINEAKTTVASATAADIWTSTGNLIDYTGTVTATSFAAAPQAGARRTLICAGAASFTAGANFLIGGVPSGTTITASANTRIDVVAITTTQFLLSLRIPAGTFGSVQSFASVDVALSNTANYFDGATTGAIGAAGQVWLVMSTALLTDTASAANINHRIWDGTTVYAEACSDIRTAAAEVTSTLVALVTLTAATNFKQSAKDTSTTSGSILKQGNAGTSSKASGITAIRML